MYILFKILSIPLISMAIINCTGNPSHTPALKGTLEADVNQDGLICFSPNLQVMMNDKPYNIDGIRDLSINLGQDWSAKQKDEFERISNDHKTCIDEEGFEFKYNTPYPQLIHDEMYTLYIRGMTADSRYHVRLSGVLYYP